MNGVKKVQILDGTTLKIIAMISMVFDHVGDMFFPGVMWPRMIGRLAMPIFSFFIAEGFAHTRDKKKYLGRLGLFALISEIPFDLAFDGKIGLGHQNIMLTFFLAGLALMLFERIRGGSGSKEERIPVVKTALGVLAVAGIAGFALLLRADYTVFAVVAVFLFYVLRQTHPLLRTTASDRASRSFHKARSYRADSRAHCRTVSTYPSPRSSISCRAF